MRILKTYAADELSNSTFEELREDQLLHAGVSVQVRKALAHTVNCDPKRASVQAMFKLEAKYS